MGHHLGLSIVASVLVAATGAVAQTDIRPLPRPGASASTLVVSAADVADTVVTGAEAAKELRVSAAAPAELALALRPEARPETLMKGHEFQLALAAGSRGDWDMAALLAAQSGPVAEDVILWQRLRKGAGDFADYAGFVARNGDWPGLALLRIRGERTIPAGADPAAVIAFFGETAPQTGRGALRLARALEAAGKPDRAEAVVVAAWRDIDMTSSEENALLDAYGKALAPHHAARLDMYLWADDRAGATRMMARVGSDRKALAEARLALQAMAPGVDTLIAKVPPALRNDGGLAYDRMYWRIEKRRRDDAATLIIEQSTSAEALGVPEEWSGWRRTLARREMREGNPQRAYDLAANHFITFTTEDYDYADLEWLAGYISLRYLDDAPRALRHFETFTRAVYTPISLSRGHYWQGRALETIGDEAKAMAAYREGARYQSSFYGLLSAEKAGVPMDPALTGADGPLDWTTQPFVESSVFQAGVMFFDAGQPWESIRFLSHLAETLPVEQLEALGDFTLSLGDPHLSVKVAKKIVREGAVPIRAYFPVIGLGIDLPVEEALALAIARRESEFFIGAVSPAGARGLMQLMPATARTMARKAGLAYAQSKLTTDPVFNATLGSAYLEDLIGSFGKNYAMVAAGYNAGPGRPRQWMKEFGDPRTGEVDVVDWIEHIPFTETQNYVMRVTESIPVYRARLTGEVQPIGLTEMLTTR